jgi:hypothetical protein
MAGMGSYSRCSFHDNALEGSSSAPTLQRQIPLLALQSSALVTWYCHLLLGVPSNRS